MSVKVRKASSPEDFERIYRFRYDIYVKEMQRAQAYADHVAGTVREPLDETAHLFLAETSEGDIVGTVRTNFGHESDFGYYYDLYGMEAVGPWYPRHVSITTKLMVAPAFRSSTLGLKLACATYHYNLERHVYFDLIDCNPHLEGYFQRFGYCAYRSRISHPEYGDVLPLILPLTDLEHLERIGSPFARICREHSPHRAANRLLHQAATSGCFTPPPELQETRRITT